MTESSMNNNLTNLESSDLHEQRNDALQSQEQIAKEILYNIIDNAIYDVTNNIIIETDFDNAKLENSNEPQNFDQNINANEQNQQPYLNHNASDTFINYPFNSYLSNNNSFVNQRSIVLDEINVNNNQLQNNNEASNTFLNYSFENYIPHNNFSVPSAPLLPDILKQSQTELFSHIISNNKNKVTRLLQGYAGYPQFLFCVNEHQKTAFMLAAEFERKEILSELQYHLAHNIQTQDIPFDQRTIIKFILSNDIQNITNCFLNGENPNWTNQDGIPFLHLAIQSKNVTKETIEHLLQIGANPYLVNLQQQTPLETAVLANRIKIVELLLSWGANPNYFNANHSGPLGLALQNDNLAIAKILLENGANPNYIDSSDASFLYQAIEQKKEDTIKLLINTPNIDLNLGNKITRPLPFNNTTNCIVINSSPLHLAIEKGELQIAALLINANANLDLYNIKGKTALHMAIECRASHIRIQGYSLSFIRLLLNKCAKNDAILNIDTLILEKTALQLAFETDFDIFMMVQNHFISQHNNQRSEDNINYLLHAISCNDLDAVKKAIFSESINLNAAVVSNGKTYFPLHFAIECKSVEITKFLLNVNANPLIKNDSNETAFDVAARKFKNIIENLSASQNSIQSNNLIIDNPTESPEKIRIILKMLWRKSGNLINTNKDPKELLSQGVSPAILKKHGTPHHSLWQDTIKENNIVLLQQLVCYGLDLNTNDYKGNTPLHLAISYSNLEMTKLLINAGFSLYKRNKDKKIPIQYAITNDILSYIQELYTNVTYLEIDFNTLNNYLNAKNTDQLEQSFKEYPGCIHLTNAGNNTLLHNAVKKQDYSLVRFLLKMGANPRHRNNEDKNALDILMDLIKSNRGQPNLNAIKTILPTYSTDVIPEKEKKNTREKTYFIESYNNENLTQPSLSVFNSYSRIYPLNSNSINSEGSHLIIKTDTNEAGMLCIWHPFVKPVIAIEKRLGWLDIAEGSDLDVVYNHVLNGGEKLSNDIVEQEEEARKHVRKIQYIWSSVFILGGVLMAATVTGTALWYSNDAIKIITVELNIYHNGTCSGAAYLQQENDPVLKDATCDDNIQVLYDGDVFSVDIENQLSYLTGDYTVIDACGVNQGELNFNIKHNDENANLLTKPGTQGQAQFIEDETNKDDLTLSIKTSKVSPSPTPSATPSTTPSISQTPTNTRTSSITSTPSPSLSPSISITQSISISPSISISASRTPFPNNVDQVYTYILTIKSASGTSAVNISANVNGSFSPTSSWTTGSDPNGAACIGPHCYKPGTPVSIPDNGSVINVFYAYNTDFNTNYDVIDKKGNYLDNFNVRCQSGTDSNNFIGCDVSDGKGAVTITPYVAGEPQIVTVTDSYYEDVQAQQEELTFFETQENFDDATDEKIESFHTSELTKKRQVIEISKKSNTTSSDHNVAQFVNAGLIGLTAFLKQVIVEISTGSTMSLLSSDHNEQEYTEKVDVTDLKFGLSPGIASAVGIGAFTLSVAGIYAIYRYAKSIDEKYTGSEREQIDNEFSELHKTINELKKASPQPSVFSGWCNLFTRNKQPSTQEPLATEEAGVIMEI